MSPTQFSPLPQAGRTMRRSVVSVTAAPTPPITPLAREMRAAQTQDSSNNAPVRAISRSSKQQAMYTASKQRRARRRATSPIPTFEYPSIDLTIPQKAGAPRPS